MKAGNCYLSVICASVILSSCTLESFNSKADSYTPFSKSFFAMDTYMTITAYGENSQKAVNAAETEVKRLEKLWSVTDENSEIYNINHSFEPVEVSSDTSELLNFGLEMGERTNGALDITLYPVLAEWGFTTVDYKVPDDERIRELLLNTGREKVIIDGNTITTPENLSVDLGSMGKGKAGDRVIEILKENGVTSALLDLGGNVQAEGSKPDGSDWKIGLQNPFGEGNFGVLEISDCAVISSGGYERYFEQDGQKYWHILDPSTGKPANSGIVSSTIVGSEGKLCDALSTAIFVMGEEKAVDLWQSSDDFEMILVTDDSKVIISEGLKDKFTSTGLFNDIEVVRHE